jgi:hypothetical protein
MSAGKARSLSKSRAPEICFTRVGSGLTHIHYIILAISVSYKHSKLFQTFVNYICKKCYNIVPHCRIHKSSYDNNFEVGAP